MIGRVRAFLKRQITALPLFVVLDLAKIAQIYDANLDKLAEGCWLAGDAAQAL